MSAPLQPGGYAVPEWLVNAIQLVVDEMHRLGYIGADGSFNSDAVNSLIDVQLNSYNTTVQPKIDQSVKSATTTVIDGVTFTTAQAAQNYINDKIIAISGLPATVPVPNVAPSMSFPGGTADGGETFTITKGTYTVATPSGVSWNVKLDNNTVFSVSALTGIVPTVVGAGHIIGITEIYTFNGQTFTGKPSANYTINTPPAVPVATSPPGPIVITNGVATASQGQYSPSATSVTGFWEDNIGNILGTGSNQLDVTNLLGVLIAYVETPTNAAGVGKQNVSAFVKVSGGVVPDYSTGIGPGFVYANYVTGGGSLTINFGAASNNPQSYDVQLTSDGVPMTNAGSFATNVTTFSYVFLDADANHRIGAQVVPRNGAGAGATAYIPGEDVILGSVATPTNPFVFVAASRGGSANTTAAMTIASPVGAKTNDWLYLVFTINDSTLTLSTNMAALGWTIVDASRLTATPEGQYAVSYVKKMADTDVFPLTLTASGNNWKSAHMVAYRGPGNYITGKSAADATANPSPVTANLQNVTTTAIGQLAVTAFVWDFKDGSGNAMVFNPQTTQFNVRSNSAWDGVTSGPPSYAMITIMDQIIPAIGATGNIPVIGVTDSSATGVIASTAVFGA